MTDCFKYVSKILVIVYVRTNVLQKYEGKFHEPHN